MSATPVTYAASGVNIEAGDELVRRIKPIVRSTFTDRVLTDIGGFGGLFDARFPEMRSPVLVSSTDGVGTKIKVAIAANRFDTIGEDLVNHCVNDILVCGAKPLFFLDYYAAGKLNVDDAEAVVTGFARGCASNGCALIGGETAEMPGIYAPGEFDLAGTIVGIVERDEILGREHVRAGAKLIALPSSGLHTNGYSLARKTLLEKYNVFDTPSELGGKTVADALLAVHRSYLAPFMNLLRIFSPRDEIMAASHITGGGIEGNTKRVIPDEFELVIDWNSWQRPPLFSLIQEIGSVPEDDIRSALNLGVGFIIVVNPSVEGAVIDALVKMGEKPFLIGEIR
jgi:phosphoribosylformylglycinamidine cyclo-ligase